MGRRIQIRLACTSGIVVTNRTVRITNRPSPPLPHRALARESPPRFPIPQRALEQSHLERPPLCLDIPLPFTRRPERGSHSVRK